MRRAALLVALLGCSPARQEPIVIQPLPPSPSASAAPTATVVHARLRPLAGDADRDGDGVPDDVDRCPDEPETFNNFEDDDGCPDVAPKKP